MRASPGEDVGLLLDVPEVHLSPVRAVGRHPLGPRVQAAGGGLRAARGPDQDGGVPAQAAAHGAHQSGAGGGEFHWRGMGKSCRGC